MPSPLILLPSFLGHPDPALIPATQLQHMQELKHYIAENEKSARQFIKACAPEIQQSELIITQLNKHQPTENIMEMLQPCLQGFPMGLLSEAGMPCIADPGNLVVEMAHQLRIPVVPMPGMNSMMMALMSSGFSGQEFAFHGYLPHDKGQRHKKLRSFQAARSPQIFMETPYRNQALFSEMLNVLNPDTHLCVAVNLSFPDQWVKTQRVERWAKDLPDLHKKPAVFIIGS